MTMPRTHSRAIEVDGVRYRWLVRSRPTYPQGIAAPMTFAVTLAERPASTLVVQTTAARPDNWLGRPSAVVTPAVVRAVVRSAVSDGWDPTAPGAFRLRYDLVASS